VIITDSNISNRFRDELAKRGIACEVVPAGSGNQPESSMAEAV
jgi:hypothetical protein